VSIGAIVRLYIGQIRPRAAQELEWFRSHPDLASAIKNAALAVAADGKRQPHQRRLQRRGLEEAEAVLTAGSAAIGRCSCFDELLSLVDRLVEPIRGLGELYVYDTSLRIGAKLGVMPTKVFLHAGTRVGARALELDCTRQAVEVSVLPAPFRRLEPHEIEDVLCIFKDELRQMRREAGERRVTTHARNRTACPQT